jgi:solute carrier family 40 (iron-regulated transporter), member 1
MVREDAEIQPHAVVRGLKIGLFAIAVFLSIIERLSRTANLLSIERDWIPVMAAPIPGIKDGEAPKHGLTQINAVMSRIDLICKLLSPIALSAFTSAVGSVRVVIATLLILNVVTWPVETWSATRVWRLNRRLREPKVADIEVTDMPNLDLDTQILGEHGGDLLKEEGSGWQQSRQRAYQAIQTTYRGVAIWLLDYKGNIQIYFAYSVWLPSIALSTLHFSVLNYSPTLTVYLLNSGFALNFITAAKALSAIAELASTFFTPWGVRMAGKVWEGGDAIDSGRRIDVLSNGTEENEQLLQQHDEDQEDGQREVDQFALETDMGVALLGFWSLIQMFLSLVSIVHYKL